MTLELEFGIPQKVYVTHVANNCTFFVQLETDEAYGLVELSENIKARVESGNCETLTPDFGLKCYAFSKLEQTWYRALISAVKGSQVTVYFVDYGNTEVVSANDVYSPSGPFFDSSYQAVCCTLADFVPLQDRSTDGLLKYFSDMLLNKEFMGIFRSRSSSQSHPFLSFLPCLNVNLCPGEGCSESVAMHLVEQNLGQFSICPENITIPSNHKVYTCFVDSPGKFWVQLSSKVDFLQSMMDNLNDPTTVSSLKKLPSSSLAPGVACCANFSEDGLYYRAEVVRKSSNKVEVCFVDYGNCETVEQSVVFQIPPNLAMPPLCAIQCCLEGIQPIKPARPDPKLGTIAWNSKACDKFNELTHGKELEAQFVAEFSPEIFSVHLVDSASKSHVGEMLSKARVAEYSAPQSVYSGESSDYQYLSLEVGQTYRNVYVSFVESPAVVWCQLPEYSSELEQILGSLAEEGPSMPVVQSPTPGQPCCVQYTLDQSWCRGTVQSVDQQSQIAQVLFVDFGNTETINLADIKQLPAQFFTLPAQAISFSMAEISPRTGSSWNDAAIAAFQGLVLEHSFNAKVVGLDQDGYPSVKLLDPLNHDSGDIGLELVRQGYARTPFKVGKSLQTSEKSSGRSGSDSYRLSSQLNAPSMFSKSSTDGFSSSQSNDRSRSSLPNRERKSSSSPRGSKRRENRTFDNKESSRHSTKPSPYSQRESPFQSHRGSPKQSPFNSSRSSSRDSSPSSHPNYTKIKLDSHQTYTVTVCHVESLDEFYCQLESDAPQLHELMGKIHAHCTSRSARKVRSPRPGMPVIALYSQDQVWYRATVSGQLNQGSGVPVVFADYGNTEIVSSNNIAQMPSYILSLPAQAIQCSLFGVPSEGTQPDSVINAFGEITIERNFHLSVKEELKDKVVVELLTSDGSSVLDQLVRDGHVTSTSMAQSRAKVVTVSVPLPEIPLRDHVDVVVSFVDSPASFYLQPLKTYSELKKLSNELNGFYSKLKAHDKKIVMPPKRGEFCVAKFSEDGVWYRARVTQLNGPQCEVCFIDYGNSETLNTADLKQLEQKFSKPPCFGIHCSLDGCSSSTPDVSRRFLELVLDKQLVAVFQKSTTDYGNPIPVKLIDTSKPSVDVDIAEALTRSQPSHKEKQNKIQIPSVTVVMNSPMDCQVTYAVSPSEFYCQLESEIGPTGNLMNKMYAYYAEQSEGSPLTSPSVGGYCAALYSDGSWYRGRITALTAQGALVFYLDYGNTDQVESSNLRTLDPQFYSMPTQALRCHLSELSPPVSGEWSIECLKKFQEFALEKTLQATFMSQQNEEGSYETQLISQNEEVAQKLCEAGYGRRRRQSTQSIKSSSRAQSLTIPAYPIKKGSKYDTLVTYVNSPLEIYCQILDPQERLDVLMRDIEVYCKSAISGSKSSYSWKPGDFALALFSEDNKWYRAVVTKILKDGMVVEVRYIDYGNSENVAKNTLMSLKPEFCSLPSQAVKCRLEGSQYYTYNNDSLVEFEKLLLNIEFELKCVSVSQGGACAVDLCRKDDMVDIMSLAIQENIVNPKNVDPTLIPSADKLRRPGSSSQRRPVEISISFPSDIVRESYHDVAVVHAETPSLFYCQFSLYMGEHLDSLMNHMQEYYTSGKSSYITESRALSRGSFLAALYSVDERWYRAQVMEATNDGARVCFVDYGNSEFIELSKLQYLDPEYAKLPAQAIPCSLADLHPIGDNWSDDAIAIYFDLVLEKTLVAQVKSSDDFCNRPYQFGDGQALEVSLIDSSEEIEQKLIHLGLATSISTPLSFSAAATPTSTTASTRSSFDHTSSTGVFSFLTFSKGDTHQMYATNIESPSAFWLQLPSAEDTLAPLQEKLATYGFGESQLLSSPAPGNVCCAKFSEDGSWYRGVVKSVLPSGVDVCFIDYGNSECVPLTEVKVLLPEFLDVPVQAVECKLHDCNPGGGEADWSDDAKGKLLDMMLDKNMSIEFVQRVYNTWDVKVFDGEQDIAAQLISNGFAAAPAKVSFEIPQVKLELGQAYPVFIAFNDTPSKFYCQLVSDCDKLESLMAEIADFYNGNHLDPLLEVGSYCVAQYSGNNAWYRAQITAFTDKGEVEVHFIDYGNSEHVGANQILALASNFASLPVQAYCCSLTTELDVEVSPKILDIFFSYDLNQEFQVKVKDVQDGRYVVDLYDQGGEHINSSLLRNNGAASVVVQQPETAGPVIAEPSADYIPLKYTIGSSIDVYISHVVSPTSFFCQPLELAAELDNMMSEVSSIMASKPNDPLPISRATLGMICIAQFSVDSEWYRAIVDEVVGENECMVTFVDYGNTEMTSMDHITPLPAKLAIVPLQAFHCSVFEGLSAEMEWSDDQVTQFHNLIMENEQLTLKITGIAPNGQYFVEVNVDGNKIEFSPLLEQQFDQTADQRMEQAKGPQNLFQPIPIEAHQEVMAFDNTNVSTLAIKGSKTPSSCPLESESENGETESDGSEGKPLIRAPFKLSLSVQEVLEVTVVHIQSPSLIYLQRVDCQGELISLSDEIQQYCASFADMTNNHQTFHKGDFVLAKYSLDEMWYRAEVTGVDSDDGTCEVYFIDYGNVEVISPENLIMCSENFLELPVQAIPCSLAQVPGRDSWPSSYSAFISELVEGKVLRATVVLPASQGMRPTVNLEDLESGLDISQKVLTKLQEECESGSNEVIAELPEGEDVDVPFEIQDEEEEHVEDQEQEDSERLPARDVSVGVTIPERVLPVGTTHKAYMISCSSPHSFVCQLACDSEALESITAHLAELYQDGDSSKELYSLKSPPKEGDHVVGQFSEDGQWYRARVLSTDKATCELLYVDFGNHEVVSLENLRALDHSLCTHPALAVECYLSGIEIPSEGRGQFSQAAAKKMQELVEDSCTIEVVSVDTGGHLGVILTMADIKTNVGSVLIQSKLASPLVPSPETTASTLISPDVGPASADEQPALADLEGFHESEDPIKQEVDSGGPTPTATSSDTATAQEEPPSLGEDSDVTTQAISLHDQDTAAQEYATSFTPLVLKCGSRYPVRVATVSTLDEFVCQVMDHTEQFQELQDSIASENYQVGVSDADTVTQPLLSQPVCSCFTGDNVWYRAEITKFGRQPNTVELRYVDLGSSEIVPLERVRRLKKSYSEMLSSLAVKCSLRALNECDLNPNLQLEGDPWELVWPTSGIRQFAEQTAGLTDGLYIEVLEAHSDGGYLVTVVDSTSAEREVNVRDLLVEKLREPKLEELENENPDPELEESDEDMFEDPLAETNALKLVEVELARATPPPSECVYEVSAGGDSVALRTRTPTPQLPDSCNENTKFPPEKDENGEGEKWEDSRSNGIEGTVPGDMEVPVPQETAATEVEEDEHQVGLGGETQVKSQVEESEEVWSDAVTESPTMEPVTNDVSVTDSVPVMLSETSWLQEGDVKVEEAQTTSQKGSRQETINVAEDFKNMDEVLQKGSLDEAMGRQVLPGDKDSYVNLEFSPGQELQLLYSNGPSPSCFCCQPFNSKESLATLMEEIKNYVTSQETATPIVSLSKGEPVIAQYSEDLTWYRGEVMSFESGAQEAEVLFVDYGNSELVPLSNICKIPCQFLELPKQAVTCSLSGVNPISGGSDWSSEAVEKFEELACGCEFMTATVNSVEAGLIEVTLKSESCQDFSQALISQELAC